MHRTQRHAGDLPAADRRGRSRDVVGTVRRLAPPLTGRSLLGAALVVVAAASVLATHRAAVGPSGDQVLVAARAVRGGTVLTAEDLLAVRSDLPGEVATVSADDAAAVLGSAATRDLPPGAVLAPSDVAPAAATTRDTGRVTLSVPPERTPVDLRPGVRVDVLATDAERGATDLILGGATVTSTAAPPEGSIGGGGPLLVELAVPDGDAVVTLVDAAVRQQVTLVVPSGDGPPTDTTTPGASTEGSTSD